jgi:recombinational DNA repair protein RecR
MKIAILIGVTNYDKLSDLVACKADVDLMEKILRFSGEYSNILSLSKNYSSELTKTKISKFISEFQEKEIDEVFFYFTGHGDFYDNQFYYLLSDFDEQKRKQTSLENSEVDSWLRSLNHLLTHK